MGDIQDAVIAFERIMEYKYKFIVSYKKIAYELELNFDEKDFYHLAGLHYLKDIDIPKTSKVLFEKIKKEVIQDEYLSKSINYLKVKENYANVKNRIYGLKMLESFLNNKNLICKYVKYKNIYSSIEADYLIKSTVSHITAYLFLRKRRKQNGYCLCSFFINPEVDYKGIGVYWLYKSKIRLSDNVEEILYNKLSKDATP